MELDVDLAQGGQCNLGDGVRTARVLTGKAGSSVWDAAEAR